MLESGRRHLLSFSVLAMVMAGAPLGAQGRDFRDSGEGVIAQKDQQSNQAHGRAMAFSASIDEMIRACMEQAAALQTLPEAVAQIVQLNGDQRSAWERVRIYAGMAARGLDAYCPRNIPVELGAKLDTLRDALSLLADSFRELRPAVVKFHDLLDDEQKGRLLAIGVSGNSASGSGQTGTGGSPAVGSAGEPSTRPICARWNMILMSWPVKQIEAGIELSYGQHAALYELSGAIYRSVEDPVDACPGDTAPTAIARLDARHAELEAVLRDIEAIRPSVTAFENFLNDAQKKQLVEAMGPKTPTQGQQAGEIVAQSPVDYVEHQGGTKTGARLNDAQKKQLPEAMGSETRTRGQQAGETAAQSSVDHGEHHGGTKIGARSNNAQKKQLGETIGSETRTRAQQGGTVAQSSVDYGEHHGGTQIAARGWWPGRLRLPWWFGFAFAPHWRLH